LNQLRREARTTINNRNTGGGSLQSTQDGHSPGVAWTMCFCRYGFG